MTPALPHNECSRADQYADIILSHFQTFQKRFMTLTRRAATRFAGRRWHDLQQDALQRLDLYQQAVDGVESTFRRLLGPDQQDKSLWRCIKSAYTDRIRHRNDRELAETFFNSTTRRILATIGVDPTVEIIDPLHSGDRGPDESVARRYLPSHSLVDSIGRILAAYTPNQPFRDVERDARRVARRITDTFPAKDGWPSFDYVDMLKSVFYRGRLAFLIGRMHRGSYTTPLVIALKHPSAGITVDAVLLDVSSVSILFSFARSHFLVYTERPAGVAVFLKSILPHKPMAEIYTSIGYVKHGKTELYRSLVEHTRQCSGETFRISRGQRGLVMIAFDMPSYDMVFKLIRDRFRNPKNTSHREVIAKYDLVFRHERAGRLPEAQTFEQLRFDRCWFSEALLDELDREARRTVVFGDEDVVFGHVFVERRVTPLDVYLKEVDIQTARRAVIDYGQAIKDLALSNIFPGDMLLKNFGVTRHGRVVFYDYDELALITDCRFRGLPPAMHTEDDLSAEPWFHVDENDVFPEEFIRFLGLPEQLKQTLIHRHGDLFTVAFWQQAQQDIRDGTLKDNYPYANRHRLP